MSKLTELADILRGIYGRKALYQEMEHPHFDGWSVARPSRFEPIWRACVSLRVMDGTHIDVGCNTGGVCRSFARRGFLSTGFDTDARCVDVSLRANEVMPKLRLHPSFVHGEWDGRKCDVMTCLSVFHSFHNKSLGPQLPGIYRAMADKSQVLVTDCVVVPSYGCKVWTVEDFAQWLKDATGKEVYLMGGNDVRPLFAVTNLKVQRNLTESFPGLKDKALSVTNHEVGALDVATWAGFDVASLPHRFLFRDLAAGRKVGVAHRYATNFLLVGPKVSNDAAKAIIAKRKEMLESIRADGIKHMVEVVIDEFGTRRVDGHHRISAAFVLGIKVPVTVYDLTGHYTKEWPPGLLGKNSWLNNPHNP